MKWWMAHYHAATPKRHWMYGNSQCILDLDRGRLTGWKMADESKRTTRSYRDKQGKHRYAGTKHLKKTERPRLVWLSYVIILFSSYNSCKCLLADSP